MRNIVAHIQNPQDDTAIEDFLRRTEQDETEYQ